MTFTMELEPEVCCFKSSLLNSRRSDKLSSYMKYNFWSSCQSRIPTASSDTHPERGING